VPDYTNSVTTAGATSVVPIVNNDSQWMWRIGQITVTYTKTGDSPQVTILKNGVPFCGTAVMLPGVGVGPTGTAGLSATFSGEPPLWKQTRDDVQCVITNGSAGALATVYAQYSAYSNNDPDVQMWKNT
jgi:hypothetical protein